MADLKPFEILRQLDQKNYDFWNQLTDEQRKSVSPYMLLRWMLGTTNERQLIMANRLVNPLVFSLDSMHNEFLIKLLTVCSQNGPKNYKWTNIKQTIKKSGKTSALVIDVLKEYLNESSRHAIQAARLYAPEDIIEMALALGKEDAEIKKLKKELGVK